MKTAFAAAAMPHPHLQVLGACREDPHDPVNGQTQQARVSVIRLSTISLAEQSTVSN